MAITYYIYVLIDPRDNEVRYVGQTMYPKDRLKKHLIDARAGKTYYSSRWIAKLLKDGVTPTMLVFRRLNTQHLANVAETFWIKEFRAAGFRLTNTMKGGKSVAYEKRAQNIDRNIYELISKEGLRRTCTLNELCNEFNIPRSDLASVGNKRQITAHGWTLLENYNGKYFSWSGNAIKISEETDDLTIREWKNKDGRVFTGTDYEFWKEHKLKFKNIKGIVNSTLATDLGWYLTAVFPTFPTIYDIKENKMRRFTLINRKGERMCGTASWHVVKGVLTEDEIQKLMSRTEKEISGWMLLSYAHEINFVPSNRKRRIVVLYHSDYGSFMGGSAEFVRKFSDGNEKSYRDGFGNLLCSKTMKNFRGWKLIDGNPQISK